MVFILFKFFLNLGLTYFMHIQATGWNANSNSAKINAKGNAIVTPKALFKNL